MQSPCPATPPDALRPGLPAAVSDVCRRCLSKSQDERFPTVRALRQALAGWLES